MSTYDSYPGKLPSITMLSQCQQQELDNAYSQETAYSNFMPNTGLYANSTTEANMHLDLYNPQHLSPPLTPAVSPPANIMDQMQFKRKYSVDVGPFGFNAHPSLAHDQDPYRRSSCSAMSVIDESEHPLDYPDYSYMNGTNDMTTSLSNDISVAAMTHHNNGHDINKKHNYPTKTNQPGKRKSAQHSQQGPNAPHKHICKYSYCGWSFKRYEHLKRHMLVHTGERPHVCTYPGCGKSFSRSDNFHAHYRTHTKKQSLDNDHPMAAASRRGSKKSNAALEINLNAGIATSPSSFSSSSSTSSQQDVLHGIHHFGFNGKPFDLPYNEMYDQLSFTDEVNDPQSYMGPPSLLNHDQTTSSMFNTNMVPYDLAGFHSRMPPSPVKKQQRKPRSTTFQQEETAQHKTHVCPMTQCQRRFKRLEHLKRHMRIHTLERPFACTFPKCHKHFSRSDNLSQHMKTHQPRSDKRRYSSSSSSSSSASSPRSTTLDFVSPTQPDPSTVGVYPDACWTLSSEFIGC